MQTEEERVKQNTTKTLLHNYEGDHKADGNSTSQKQESERLPTTQGSDRWEEEEVGRHLEQAAQEKVYVDISAVATIEKVLDAGGCTGVSILKINIH